MTIQVHDHHPVTAERWRDVPGYEGRYEVSDHGNVYSWPASRIKKPRLLRPWQQFGYSYVNLVDADGKAKKFRVHRLVLLAFVRPPEGDEQVRHLNGVKTDNRLANLAWGSAKENQQDNIRLGVNANLRKTHCKQGHEFTPENTYRMQAAGRDRPTRICRICRAVSKRESAERTVAPVAGDGDPRHGSTTGYKRGCRCSECRRANADAIAERRARTGRR